MLFHTYSVAKRQNVGENYSTKPLPIINFQTILNNSIFNLRFIGLTHFNLLLSFSRMRGSSSSHSLPSWIPVPRLRGDKLHGNDTDCVSPKLLFQIYLEFRI